jgi:CheY-like chemotaxis protein
VLFATILRALRRDAAAAPAPAVRVEPTFDIPGFDLAAALERCDGDETLLRDLLRRFAERYRSVAPTLIALVRNEPAEARRLAHTLYGVAATIGAVAAADDARSLEQALGDGSDPTASVERLERSLAAACAAIARLDRARVLIVDDDDTNLTILRRVLERDFDVVEANDGVRAIELARAVKPRVALLDVIMPSMSGFELLARLKDDSATAEIDVLLLTGLDDAQTRARASESGAAGVIAKPFKASQVRDRVRALLHSEPTTTFT